MRPLRRSVRRFTPLLCVCVLVYLTAEVLFSVRSVLQERTGMVQLGEKTWKIHRKKFDKSTAVEDLRELVEWYVGDETPTQRKDNSGVVHLGGQTKLLQKPENFSKEAGPVNQFSHLVELEQLSKNRRDERQKDGPDAGLVLGDTDKLESETNDKTIAKTTTKSKIETELGTDPKVGKRTRINTSTAHQSKEKHVMDQQDFWKIRNVSREGHTNPDRAGVGLGTLKKMKGMPLVSVNYRIKNHHTAAPRLTDEDSREKMAGKAVADAASEISAIFVRGEDAVPDKFLRSGKQGLTKAPTSAASLPTYNHTLSDSLPLNRRVPDTRPPGCSTVHALQLPTWVRVTVVLAHHNERTSTLLRTIASVVRNTPVQLLQHIVLVDDASDTPFRVDLQGKIPRLLQVMNDVQLGVSASRAKGVSMSTGSSHVVFLDSHCEVNAGWLEPLLTASLQTPSALISPVLDVIVPQTLQYRRTTELLRAGFGWGLRFRWLPAAAGINSTVQPYSTPVLAGGLFLVSRQRWEEIGGYDPGFLERGGDSIEMSLKSWMCGGQVLVAPCSRVGHLFVRSSTKKPGALLRNTRRIAEVWLDDFKQFYYDLRPQALYKLYGDISPQLELKKRLKCQDFSWYLKKVYPELTPPRRLTERHGKLRHQFICLSFVQAAEHRNADSQAVTETAKNFLTQEMCSAAVPFELTTDGLLRVNDWCLSSSPPTDARVLLKFCGATTTERWQYDNVTGKLVHVASNWCLDVAGADSVITQACVDNPRVQTWSFE